MNLAGESIDTQTRGEPALMNPGLSDVAWRQNLSEELRTRLNAIVGFAELLGLDPLPANSRSDVRQILNAARDILTIINRELTPTSAQSGTNGTTMEQLSKTTCDLLYIEDDIANITLIERILDLRPGVTLKHANLGYVGIEMAKSENPKLILLDLNLPDINGADVLQALQNDAQTSRIPVVMLSANAVPTQIERLLAAGARNYLTKPFQLDQFLAVVDEWIRPNV